MLYVMALFLLSSWKRSAAELRLLIKLNQEIPKAIPLLYSKTLVWQLPSPYVSSIKKASDNGNTADIVN